jgi:hypothetical protein
LEADMHRWIRLAVSASFTFALASTAAAQGTTAGAPSTTPAPDTTASGDTSATSGGGVTEETPFVPAGYTPAPGASAEEAAVEPEITTPAPPRRGVGLGTAFGGGIAAGGAYAPGGASGFTYVSPAVELPAVEGLFFIDDHLSIDVSIPIMNTIIVAALGNAVAWATNVYLDFSIGDDWVRFIVGPALGFAVVSAPGITVGQINVGALVGLELLSSGRGFGFRVMSRPQVQFPLANLGGGFVVGGNALLELAFIGYIN